jgi:CheY-like chemotaxis protein
LTERKYEVYSGRDLWGKVKSGNPGRHSKKGLGLGLSIVQRLADLLGYPVSLHSVVGKGSVFSIEVPLGHAVLPQVQATGMRTATTTPTTSDVFANRLVAVIDDEDTILKGMQTLLAGWGLEVAVGHDADETLERLGELGRYPDLLIVDFRLQEGLTGVQAIQRLRNELGADIPALLVTGSTSAAHAIEAEQHGYQFLTKPVMPAKLRAIVEQKLRDAQPAARP